MTLEAALAEFTPNIGTEFQVSPWVTMTQERIDRFADATGDHQWIHVDPERARAESPYGATIAHGYLVLSLYPTLRGHDGRNTPPSPGVTRTINYGVNRVRFPSPVPAGSRLRGRFVARQCDRAHRRVAGRRAVHGRDRIQRQAGMRRRNRAVAVLRLIRVGGPPPSDQLRLVHRGETR